ncbi:FAD-dependent oxidoreductase [Paraburkholderia phymatum]|uniref:FAD-dependent oxidoreductase n=1 Tax=Paraburkholderia phymatum TaxID=148447 RepID=A0ACC6U9B5_9BURK
MKVEKPSFFQWEKYPFEVPPELGDRRGKKFQVAVVGAGPVGLATALSLAQQGVSVVVLEARDQLSDSSRTLAVSRRSVQVLDRLGVAEQFRALAVVRERNYIYCGENLIHSAPYEQSPTEKFPDVSVLQQPWTEKVLLDAVVAHSDIELRWLSAVTGVRQDEGSFPTVSVQTERGNYELQVDYVVAADGARGQVRRSLGLAYEEVGDGVVQRNFVICDFEMKTSHPVARRLWIRPPYKPQSAVLLHKQPFDTWRLDYALEDDEQLEDALRPENVAEVVADQVRLLMGSDPLPEWRIVWISSYRPMSRSLTNYRHGRVFFAGDSAHQTPIFGGRGMNQGLLDASNLAWRLATVLNGGAPDALLDRYDAERRPTIVRNLHAIGQATLCMTAPTPGSALMRKAAFDLLPDEPFIYPLIDAFNANRAESLLTPPPEQDPVRGAQEGSPLPDASVDDRGDGHPGFLYDRLARHAFTGIYLSADGNVPRELQHTFDDLQAGGVPVSTVVLAHTHAPTVFEKLDGQDGTWVLVRPDGYVGARIDAPSPETVTAAVASVLCLQQPSGQCDGNRTIFRGSNLNAAMEQSFRSVALALDELQPADAVDFLARLTLLLADEIRDGQRFAHAVDRARDIQKQGEQA